MSQQQRPQFSRSSTVSTTAPKTRGRPAQPRPAASVRSSSVATSSARSSSYGPGGGNYGGASPLDAVINNIDRIRLKDKQPASYTYYGSPLRLGGGGDTIYTYYGQPLPHCRAKMDAERYQTIDKANGWGPYSSHGSGGPPSSSRRDPNGPPEISRPKTLDAISCRFMNVRDVGAMAPGHLSFLL
ncbi:unnamed protein product [Peniophora sp. CBMAI 1063]|nr:unnamed protein product [Peniophora sp. CBMAI 1063]